MPGTFGGGGVEVFAGTVIDVGDRAAQAPSKSAQIARTDSIIFISAWALLQAFHISELKFNPRAEALSTEKGTFLA